MHYLIESPIHFISAVMPLQAQFVIFCADTLPKIVALWAIIYLLFRHEPRRLMHLVVAFGSAFLAYGISLGLKSYFKIGRPDVLNFDFHPLLSLSDYGFPSSHATFFAALAAALFFIHRRAGIFVAILALVIGTARIFAGVHTPLDIFGGYLLGMLVAVVVSYLGKSLRIR
jgi:undecaprenyl-diphosphatase